MAEYVLRHRAREAGMGNAVITASAGTSGLARRRKHVTKARAACSNNTASTRQALPAANKPSDAEQHFDYIIVMDDNNLRETEKQLGFHPGKIFKLTDLIPDSDTTTFPIRGTQATLMKPTAWSMPAVWPCWKIETGLNRLNNKRSSEQVSAKAMLS